MIDSSQIKELDSTIERVYDRHMQAASKPIDPVHALQTLTHTESEDWFTTLHKLRTDFDDHQENLETEDITVKPALAASFLVNILTEDNLPHYVKRIETIAQHTDAFQAWLGQWTAEEAPHSTLMRDYALGTGIIAPHGTLISSEAYHEGITSQLQTGTEIKIDSIARGFAYLSLQEILTYVAHQRVGQLLDNNGQKALWKIAGNEVRHHRVYAALTQSMLENYPDETVIAIRDVFSRFEMPGSKGIPEYTELAKTIALSGIFGINDVVERQQEHVHKIYKLADVELKSDDAKIAREELVQGNADMKRKANVLSRLLDRKAENHPESFILGKTVVFNDKSKKLERQAA